MRDHLGHTDLAGRVEQAVFGDVGVADRLQVGDARVFLAVLEEDAGRH